MPDDFEMYTGTVQRGLAEDQREESPPRLETFSAYELQHMDLPPLEWIVDGLIVRGGLGVVAAPSKYGKSFMCMQLCTAITTGQPFLGLDTTQGRALYLALEDSKRRLKSRQEKQFSEADGPVVFDFAIRCGTTADGLYDELEDYIMRNPDVSLIVIDTLQKVRSNSGRGNVYAEDYNEIGKLKEFADDHNLTILAIHHLRKKEDENDPFGQISGSTAILGAADFAFVLTKKKRMDTEAVLHITGRDIEEDSFSLVFDKEHCLWVNEGKTADIEERRARVYYNDDPVVQTIKKLLKSKDKWEGSASELMKAVTIETGFEIPDTARAFSEKVTALANPLSEYDDIVYWRIKNGSGGGKHRFTKNNR